MQPSDEPDGFWRLWVAEVVVTTIRVIFLMKVFRDEEEKTECCFLREVLLAIFARISQPCV